MPRTSTFSEMLRRYADTIGNNTEKQDILRTIAAIYDRARAHDTEQHEAALRAAEASFEEDRDC